MADRYWVGGSGIWNTTNTANWSASSGGASGASVPTAADNVFFDQAAAYTVTLTGALTCLNFTVSAGTVTFSNGTAPSLAVSGSFSLATGTVWSSNLTITFNATTTGQTITTNGVSIAGGFAISGVGGEWTLGSALTLGLVLTLNNGTFTTANYNLSVAAISSSNSNARTLNLGNSTVTVSASGATAINFSVQTNLTFNAGTSTINMSNAGAGITTATTGVTFYNVSFTNTTKTTCTVVGNSTFNNLTFSARTTLGISTFSVGGNLTVNGTFTVGAAASAVSRTVIQSNASPTGRTLTINSFAAGSTDIDFRDITVTGAAAPISGTRFGDAKNNSGITFPTAKTVYWNLATGGNWSAAAWATSSGGSPNIVNFPLAQDTAVFEATGLNSGTTIALGNSWFVGTVNMSARTSNTMTLNTGSFAFFVFGNWINGTGTTLSGTGIITFAGRGAQTITNAGRVFTQPVAVNSPSGSVTMQDAFTCSNSAAITLILNSGTLDFAGYNATLSSTSSGFNGNTSNVRTLAIGSGTFTIAGSSGFDCSSSTNLTVTGTGVISLNSGSPKSFNGGNIQTYPTLNQGGTGSLTVTGSNKFLDITDTATGSVLFTGGTTNEFNNFSLSGSAGNTINLSSTNTTPAILKKPSTWFMGANSADFGNNTGLIFSAGGGIDYLTISYITGQTTTIPTSTYFGNFFLVF